MTIEEILAGESKNVEFKENLPEKSIKYMKTVVAFANGSGGKIIFGVRDEDIQVVGIQSDSIFRTVDAITNAISDSCTPVIVPDITLQTIEGKTIIIVEITSGRQRPYYIKSQGMENGTYIRVAGSTRPAESEQIQEMYYESAGRSYDCLIRKDITITEEEINEVCQMMKKVALSNCKNEYQCSSVKTVTKNTLLSWGILAEENGKIYPTNAYVFLLGLDSFLSRIQCGVFKGTTRAVFVDRREYTGPLWKQIENAYQFVLRNIHLGAKIEGIYRQDVYELPPESIRELIVNAAVHCSFLQSSLIQIAVFDDRLEITSPGGLLPGVTIEKMKEGYSKVRNHAIASAFSYMNIIEQWGSGIPRIIREVSEYGLSAPEFIDMECALRINIYRNTNEMIAQNNDSSDINGSDGGNNGGDGGNNGGDGGNNGGDRSNRLSENEQIIIKQIKQDGSLTAKMMSENTGLPKRTVERAIKQLKEKSIIIRKGSSRKGYWEYTEK